MSAVILKLPEVKRKNESRPTKCPYCQGNTFQRWGKVRKRVLDNRIKTVWVYRYLCCNCRRTFRHYPEGVDRADQTKRLRKISAIFWELGLSLRNCQKALSAMGVRLSHMSVWRNVQEQAELLAKRKRKKRVRVLGVDGVYPLVKGKKRCVLVAVDLGNGEVVTVGQVEESDPEALREWLEPLVKELGVEVLVSDDLGSYRVVTEEMGLEHQVCQFHVRRWVNRDIRELREGVPKGWEWVLEEVKECLEELREDGGRRLYELWKQIPEEGVKRGGKLTPLGKLRRIVLRLSENWGRYTAYKRRGGVPWTNNGTERVIGMMQMRNRTVRGYKSERGMFSALMLSGSGLSW